MNLKELDPVWQRATTQRTAMKGFYINLDGYENRRKEVESQLEAYGTQHIYSRFQAANGNVLNLRNPHLKNGAMGCYTSHYLVLKENLGIQDHLHIVEDDVVFSQHTQRTLDQIIASGKLAQYDILFTDVFLGSAVNKLAHLRRYKSLHDELVQYDNAGKLKSFSYIIFDLKDVSFFSTTSYLVAKNSIPKLHALLQHYITNEPRLPIDVFYQILGQEGQLKIGCVFPFITSCNIEHRLDSAIDGAHKDSFAIIGRLISQAFFIDCDFVQCQSFLAKHANLPADDCGKLLANVLASSLTWEQTEGLTWSKALRSTFLLME